MLDPRLHSYGGQATCCGPAATLKVFEDNTLVRTALEAPGVGRVLVIDGGASLRFALVGDQIAQLAWTTGGRASSCTARSATRP